MYRLVTGSMDPAPILCGLNSVNRGDEVEVHRKRGRREWAFFLIVSGCGYFEADGKLHPAHRGHFYAIEPGTPHHYGSDRGGRGWRAWWVHVHPRPSWTPWMDWPEVSPGLRRLAVSPPTARQISTVLQHLEKIQHSHRRLRAEYAMNLFEQVLLLCDENNPRSRPTHDSRLEPALHRMNTRPQEPAALNQLAALCAMSRTAFTRSFRQSTGTTPVRYLENQRLERARHLLALTGATVTAIAEETGFATVYYFSLRFKKATGLTPLAYRQSARSDPAPFPREP